VAEADVDVATRAWRGIDELAGLVGAYCWVENRIFELTGSWASAPAPEPGAALDPALRVWCAGVSTRHGAWAGRWAERLPVRAGVDRAALMAAPEGPLEGALAALAATPETFDRVAALVETVLPRLRGVYGAHLGTASPVSEAPVLEVLVGAHRDLAWEIGSGRSLIEVSPGGSTAAASLGAELERAFDGSRVFPAVCAS
jgi:hypothetical protein